MADRRFGQSRFYESLTSESNIQFNDSIDNEKDLKSLKPSRQLPKWIWILLVHILGIKRTGEKRVPCLSVVLQGILLLLACTFTITGMVHTVYDIRSTYSKTTLVIGCVNILLGFGWIALGIYSHKLAGKLFTNRNFAESVRIHTRTFFKVSAAGLLIFLSTTVITLNCYNDYKIFGPNHCDKIFLHPAVCHVMYASHVAFSAMSLIWNVLVGCVLLSVCRTHTIGIRRFIRQLEDDAKVLDDIFKTDLTNMDFISANNADAETSIAENDSEWFIWDDSIRTDMDRRGTFSEGISDETTQGLPVTELQRSTGSIQHSISIGSANSQAQNVGNDIPTTIVENEEVVSKENDEDNSKLGEEETSYLRNEQLLNSYWKISNRMRITSQCLQRWFASWAMFVFVWCADFIVYWLSNPATVIDILEFSIPLMLLFILTVAYAECNGEGQRMIRCIYPAPGRMKILDFLGKQPLQMQVFSFSVTYNTIFGVVLAFAVAFASRIILDEMDKI